MVCKRTLVANASCVCDEYWSVISVQDMAEENSINRFDDGCAA